MFLSLGLASLIEALLIAMVHWFPWNKVFHQELQAPWTYIVGVSLLASVYSVWVWLIQPTPIWAMGGLWAIIAAGGLADLIAYGLDWILGMIWIIRHGSVDSSQGDRSGGHRQS